MAGPLASSHPGMDHSTAVDARLEAGVSLLSELRLHMMAAVHTSRLSLAVTAPLKVECSSYFSSSSLFWLSVFFTSIIIIMKEIFIFVFVFSNHKSQDLNMLRNDLKCTLYRSFLP